MEQIECSVKETIKKQSMMMIQCTTAITKNNKKVR